MARMMGVRPLVVALVASALSSAAEAQPGRVAFLTRAQLEAAACFDPEEGPAMFCSFNARSYARKLTIDSRYRVRVGGRSESFDASWCGLTCTIPNSGTGIYEGSYYTQATYGSAKLDQGAGKVAATSGGSAGTLATLGVASPLHKSASKPRLAVAATTRSRRLLPRSPRMWATDSRPSPLALGVCPAVDPLADQPPRELMSTAGRCGGVI